MLLEAMTKIQVTITARDKALTITLISFTVVDFETVMRFFSTVSLDSRIRFDWRVPKVL